jgi:hypothetical protein
MAISIGDAIIQKALNPNPVGEQFYLIFCSPKWLARACQKDGSLGAVIISHRAGTQSESDHDSY